MANYLRYIREISMGNSELESKVQNWRADLNTRFKFQNSWSRVT